MQTATTTKATTATVAAHLSAYTGPLANFLKRQAEVKAAAAEQQAALQAMRANITGLVSDPHLFTDTERLLTNDSVYQCESIPQLQRWFRNVYRVYQEREGSLQLGFADGSYIQLSVATA
ncbi:hypothetical protein [Hymenobacter fodinae]|uniref:Uncharacterized protein n=1 Tax=Hymenobacter fodinae TaxID=2510796 RepID=A0A4Z0P5N4_9BACT|nr:hypothetical protein [Hymenobacter fodinae]TGE07713.1 hypothetical protein EU556_08135 [Hymenobacter fodinae]